MNINDHLITQYNKHGVVIHQGSFTTEEVESHCIINYPIGDLMISYEFTRVNDTLMLIPATMKLDSAGYSKSMISSSIFVNGSDN